MVTFEQLKILEKYLDQAWKMLGIDVSFTKHFLERANDPRNGKPIDIRELQKLFVDAYKRYGSMFARMKLGDNEIEGVLTDLSTKINSPFVLSWDKRTREFDLRAKTVMRKNNFVPNNPRERKYTVEDRNSNSHMWSDYDRSSGPTWTDWIAKKLGTKKWVVANQLTDKLKEKGYTVAISQAKYSELNRQFRSLHEEQERKQMSLNKRFGVSDEFAKIANAIAEETYKQREEEARALAEASKAKMAELLGEEVEQIDEGNIINKAKKNLIAVTKGGGLKNRYSSIEAARRVDDAVKAFKGDKKEIRKQNNQVGKWFKPELRKGRAQMRAEDTNEDVELDEAFDNGPGDKRAAEIKKELDADFNKKKTWKEKFKKFRRELHYATNVSKLPKHLQDDVQEDVVDEDRPTGPLIRSKHAIEKTKNVISKKAVRDADDWNNNYGGKPQSDEYKEKVRKDTIISRKLGYKYSEIDRQSHNKKHHQSAIGHAEWHGNRVKEDIEQIDEISTKTLMSYRTKADRDRMETWGKKENSYKTILKQKNAYNLAKASGKEDEAAAVKKRFDKTNANFKAQGKHIEKRADGIRMADMKIGQKWREERNQYEEKKK